MNKLWKFKIAFVVVAGIIALSAIVMWLWNWLVPELFHGPVITIYHALGLMLLTRILFRGFHGNRCGGMYGGKWGAWKGRWDKMSPEERERMRELWKKRCGGFDCDEEKKSNEQTN